jgi:hypothetical protein
MVLEGKYPVGRLRQNGAKRPEPAALTGGETFY